MNWDRWAPIGATAICLLFLLVIAWPYFYLPEDAYEAIGRYYGAGIFGMTIIASFAVILLVILGAGITGRTDGPIVAGATIGIGVVMGVMASEWIIAARAIAGGAWMTYHPWLIVGLAWCLVVAGLLYARQLDLI